MELGGSLKPSLVIIFAVLLGTSGCLGSDVSLANWPDGYESAVVISFDVEQAQASDLQRVTLLLDKYNAKATFFVVAGYYEGAESTLEPLREYEVANKGWDQGEWAESYEEQRDSIKRSHVMLSSLGFNPTGFRAPFLMNNQETFAALSDLGYLYDSSDNGMLPTLHGEIVEIPLSIAYDPFWNEEVEDYLPLLYLAFENTYDENGAFTFYTLPEKVDERWEAFLKHVSGRDVWLASGSDVAEWWKKREKLTLRIVGDKAVVTNNGENPISGVTLRLKDREVILPEIKPGDSARVTI